MHLQQALAFPFQDKDWFRKAGVIGIVAVLPVVGWLVAAGWGMDIARGVIRAEPTSLPELQFRRQLREGFEAAVAGLVYFAPLLMAIAFAALSVFLPPALPIGETPAGTLAGVLGAVAGVLLLASIVFLLLMLPPAIGVLAAGGRLADAFQWKVVFTIFRSAPAAYLVFWPAALVAWLAGWVGVVVCCIGLVISAPYAWARPMRPRTRSGIPRRKAAACNGIRPDAVRTCSGSQIVPARTRYNDFCRSVCGRKNPSQEIPMEQTPVPITPSAPKSQKVQTIGILMLISGILNILVGLGGGAAFVLSLVLICCSPVFVLPIVLGVFEIYYASKLLSASGERQSFSQVQVITILEICTLLVGNIFSAVIGVVNVILLNDPEVRPSFL
jgi:hypothetical protein